MSNKEKFLKLVSKERSTVLNDIEERIKNRAFLRESQKIAIKVLVRLDELGWSQKALAEKLGVSPQQVSKIVSGKENLTLETQVKLQEALDIPILASYLEEREDHAFETKTYTHQIVLNIPMSDFADTERSIYDENTPASWSSLSGSEPYQSREVILN